MIETNTSIYGTSTLVMWLLWRFNLLETNRSDLEKKWADDEEAFRSELAVAMRKGEAQGWRSTATSNMVHNKVLGALAVLMDTAFSGGRVPFALVPVDVPPGLEEESQWRADGMDRHMRWQQEVSNEDREARRCALYGFIYGCGWNERTVKAIPVKRPKQLIDDSAAYSSFGDPMAGGGMDQMRWGYEEREEFIPASDTPSVWDMFWDYEARDISEMETIVRRRFLSPYQLRSLTKNGGGYIAEAVERVLRSVPRVDTWSAGGLTGGNEAPDMQSASAEDPKRDRTPVKLRSIRHLRFTTMAPRSLVEAFEAGQSAGDGTGSSAALDQVGDDVEVLVEVAGREIIRLLRLERSQWPFDFWQAEEALDDIGPRGVADNTRQAWIQETGFMRAAQDNANLAGNLVFVENESMVESDGESKEIYPGMTKRINGSVRGGWEQAIGVLNIPDITGPLLAAQDRARDRGDDDSGVPRLIQGMPSLRSGVTATEISETASRGMQTFGQFMRNFDDGRIEPMEQFRLEYNLDDPALARFWGPFKVQALGFSGFQGRVIRFNKIVRNLQIILSDSTGELVRRHKLGAIMEELWKECDSDPEQFMRSEEEMQQRAMEELAAQQAAAMGQVAPGQTTIPPQEASPVEPTQPLEAMPGEDADPMGMMGAGMGSPLEVRGGY